MTISQDCEGFHVRPGLSMACDSQADQLVNVAARLTETAQSMPDALAVVMPRGRWQDGRRRYDQITFAQLDQETDRIAAGLGQLGAHPGMRLVLLVPPSIEFIALFFAMLKAGVVTVLIDPGMGRKRLLQCLKEVEPDGFVAIPLAQAVRALLRRRFAKARLNVTVGRRWLWFGATLDQLRVANRERFQKAPTTAQDPAAIIFTTGSTGPPKGVLYRHGNFNRQVDELQRFYQIQPGEIDLPSFPLFALFNSAMGVTTVIPDMDPTRPAQVNPSHIIEAIRDWQVTQAFGSPALWNVVGQHCERERITLPSVRRVLSAGAPVPAHVLRRMQAAIHPDGDVHTPYGATEALPVASISARQVLSQTLPLSQQGAGTCIGRRFPGIEWKVIEITDQPIGELAEAAELPAGQIGELIVSGPVVTDQYVTRREANAFHKIHQDGTFWHRMGDVGYLDESDRFWFCGRKSHRVRTTQGVMFTIPCEAIFNNHEQIYRSALVGIGPAGAQVPVIVVEPWPACWPKAAKQREELLADLKQLGRSHDLTRTIEHILLHRSLPVDIRHNAKIFREQLAVWAAGQLRGGQSHE